MEYKEKLVELMTKCLNDEKLYAETIDQVDPYRSTPHQLYYNKVSAICCGHYDKKYIRYVDYYYNNVVVPSISEMKKKYKLDESAEYTEKEFLSELQINFEELPPLRLQYSSEKKTEQEKINIPHKKFLFFDGPKQHVIKTITTYIPSYEIQQGSLKAQLTLEEAGVLISLYQTNKKKFAEKRDLEKLDNRLKAYNS